MRLGSVLVSNALLCYACCVGYPGLSLNHSNSTLEHVYHGFNVTPPPFQPAPPLALFTMSMRFHTNTSLSQPLILSFRLHSFTLLWFYFVCTNNNTFIPLTSVPQCQVLLFSNLASMTLVLVECRNAFHNSSMINNNADSFLFCSDSTTTNYWHTWLPLAYTHMCV